MNIPAPKVRKTFRMPLDVLAWLETEGERIGLGYQTAMVLILRRAMQSGQRANDDRGVPDEARIREIVRDELGKKKVG